MGETSIEWTDFTWNPVSGCTKVSQGCKHCYAERMFPRAYAGTGRRFIDVATHEDRLEQPLRMRSPKRIFVNSMSDLFHEDAPDAFLDRVFAVMAMAQRHTFQVLTKRPERMRRYLSGLTFERVITACNLTIHGKPHGSDGESSLSTIDGRSLKARFVAGEKTAYRGVPRLPFPNVWLGVSVEDQKTADERIPLLIQTPAAVRFLSCEPLLGPVDLGLYVYDDILTTGPGSRLKPAPSNQRRLHWVIAGGESGPGARPMHPDWAASLRDQCRAAGVPFLFKQWGSWLPVDTPSDEECFAEDGSDRQLEGRVTLTTAHGQRFAYRTKAKAGRMLDGRIHDDYPTGAR